jgi:hypothetical protein
MTWWLDLIPVATSLVLGVVFLYQGETRPLTKILGVAVFAVAVCLQFFTRHALAGLLLQGAIALCLAVWWRMGRLTWR